MSSLGTFVIALQLGNLDGRDFVDLEALVDTGATYTSVPEDTLDRLGIIKRETRTFELADDRVIGGTDWVRTSGLALMKRPLYR